MSEIAAPARANPAAHRPGHGRAGVLPENLPLELQLLLAAIRHPPSNEGTERLQALAAREPDWNRLCALAARHHVIPQLYSGLQQAAWPATPEPVRARLQQVYASNLKRNLRLASHAATILRAFQAARIRVIPFKGVFLAQSVYGSLSSREVSDIDLLIGEADAGIAAHALEMLGYAGVQKLDQQEVFRNLPRQIEIDLHWHVAPEFFPVTYDFERLWQRSFPAGLAGREYRALHDEDLLLLLCVQLAKDCWERRQKVIHLQKLCDIARLVGRVPAAGLTAVQAAAAGQGLARVLDLGMLLAQAVMTGELPAPLAGTAGVDRHALALARQALALPALAETELPPARNELWDLRLRFRQLRFYLQLRESPRDRRRHLGRVFAALAGRGTSRAPGPEVLAQERSRQLLAAAALSDGAEAITAWQAWLEENDLDTLDGASYWILPLLHRNLSRLGFSGAESPRLAGVYKQMRIAHALAREPLLELLGSLRAGACDVLAGPLLALGLRDREEALSLNPAEYLVPAQQLELADPILRARGWQPSMPLPAQRIRPFVGALRYRHPQLRDLSLCWRPFGLECPPQSDRLCWAGRSEAAPDAAAIPIPSAEDMVLMTALRGSRLQFAVVRDRLHPDWRAVEARAATLGLEAARLARREAPVPDESAALPVLWRRHRARYARCPPELRPAGFWIYLAAYYAWAWRTRQ